MRGKLIFRIGDYELHDRLALVKIRKQENAQVAVVIDA